MSSLPRPYLLFPPRLPYSVLLPTLSPPATSAAAFFFAFAGEMPSLHHPTIPPASIPLTTTPLAHLVGGRLPPPPHFTNSVKFPPFPPKIESFLQIRLKSVLSVGLAAAWWSPVASMAAEAEALTEQASGKISFESIVLTVDDFINRYPFFFASVSAVWLIVIPLTQEYLKKYKFISAFDGYLKLRDDPSAQLLDIRNRKTLRLRAPDLRPLNKEVVYVEFSGDDDGFVKEVLGRFSDPGNTVLCVVDNFDGDSLKAAELLFKSGFKEVYAIKGGLRGKKGWQEIQATLLPPSLHIYSRKKSDVPSRQLDVNGERNRVEDSKGPKSSSNNSPEDEIHKTKNGYVKAAETTAVQGKLTSDQRSSPYPNYLDLKPPSSPTPSKPTK